MIISIAPAGPSRLRRAFAGVACIGLAAVLLLFLDFPGSAPATVPAHAAPHAHVFSGDREIARPRDSGAFEDAASVEQAPRRGIEAAHPVVAPTPQRPELPFRFLGTLDAGGETSLVLYGRGRTLTVRGAGPLDDEYVVDAIEDGHLTLRHVASGISHRLELVSRQRSDLVAGSAAETSQD
jgi:hypothetical protein